MNQTPSTNKGCCSECRGIFPNEEMVRRNRLAGYALNCKKNDCSCHRVIDPTDNCYLEWGEEDGRYLVCTYNHKDGEECLANKCEYCGHLTCKCYEETK